MKTIKMLLALTVITVFVVGTSCKKDEEIEEEKTAQPELPPESALAMNFSDFDSTSSKSKGTDTTGYYQNFGHSCFNVLFWNVFVAVPLSVPVSVFVNAINQTSTWDKDIKKWKWEYTTPVNNINYTAKLTGVTVADSVNWEMYISKEGGYQNFKWFYGASKVNKTNGWWVLNKGYYVNKAWLGIYWNRDITNNTGNIMYKNIEQGHDENGGYIQYGSTSDTDYDRFYKIYNKGLGNLTHIKWNYTNKDGRVSDNNRFGTTDWQCWSTSFIDITCSK